MMQTFKADILHETKMLQVLFSRIAAPGSKYFVELKLDDSVVAHFEMQKDQFNKWKVTTPVHGWVLQLENQLAQVIIKNNFITAVQPY